MSTENQVQPASTTTTATKKQITTELLRELMLGGMNRKDIATHLGAPVSTINRFFKHPDLADLRPKHKSAFELVDSTGKTYSPGALAQAAKEAKQKEETEEVAEDVNAESTNEVTNTQIAESTGI